MRKRKNRYQEEEKLQSQNLLPPRLKKKRKGRKGRRGQASYVECSKPTKGSGLLNRITRRLNSKKSNSTMKIYRQGYLLCWRHCSKYMTEHGIPPPHSFRKNNMHGGVLWDCQTEVKITGHQCAKLLELLWESKQVTLDQLKMVSKTWSYTYSLVYHEPQSNFPVVKLQMKSLKGEVHAPSQNKKPERIPQTGHLKQGFTTEWRRDCGMAFLPWCVGLLASWDYLALGMRRKEDLNRIKRSSEHVMAEDKTWQKTMLHGGRCKLTGDKKGNRPWGAYRICLCKGGKHQGPLKEDVYPFRFDKAGNPKKDPTWCTTCPISCVEVVFGQQTHNQKKGVYRKWLKTGRMNLENVNDLHELSMTWMRSQKALTGEEFSRNCGRKSLGRWTSQLNVEYEQSVEIHGDHEDTWRKYYDKSVKNPSKYECREQSEDPTIATAALRKLSEYFGVRKAKSQFSQKEILQLMQMSTLGPFTPSQMQQMFAGDLSPLGL